MASAGLVEAALQFLARTVEEQGGDLEVVTLAQRLDLGDHPVRIEAAGAAVEADGQRGGIVRRLALDHAFEKADREIVDDFPPEVFEYAQHRRLAGTEHAGHEQDFLLVGTRGEPGESSCIGAVCARNRGKGRGDVPVGHSVRP